MVCEVISATLKASDKNSDLFISFETIYIENEEFSKGFRLNQNKK